MTHRSVPPSARAAVVRPRTLGARVTAALAVLLALGVTMLGAAVVTVATAGPAGAHDHLEASDPPADAELAAPPVQVVLTYSGDILPTGSQVVVTTPDGPVEAQLTVDGPEVTAALPPNLPGGAYEVAWRVVSSDGHPIEGTFGFTVAAQPTPSPAETDDAATDEPTATDEPATDEPTATAEPAPEATDAAADGDAVGGSGMPWLFGLALLVIVAVAAAAVWRTRRQLHQGHGPAGQD